MVPNSCATHALVSILLNIPRDNLGHTLSKLKAHVEGIEDSETKGWAIGNCPELAQVWLQMKVLYMVLTLKFKAHNRNVEFNI